MFLFLCTWMSKHLNKFLCQRKYPFLHLYVSWQAQIWFTCALSRKHWSTFKHFQLKFNWQIFLWVETKTFTRIGVIWSLFFLDNPISLSLLPNNQKAMVLTVCYCRLCDYSLSASAGRLVALSRYRYNPRTNDRCSLVSGGGGVVVARLACGIGFPMFRFCAVENPTNQHLLKLRRWLWSLRSMDDGGPRGRRRR